MRVQGLEVLAGTVLAGGNRVWRLMLEEHLVCGNAPGVPWLELVLLIFGILLIWAHDQGEARVVFADLNILTTLLIVMVDSLGPQLSKIVIANHELLADIWFVFQK